MMDQKPNQTEVQLNLTTDKTLNIVFSPMDAQGNTVVYVPNQSTGTPVPASDAFAIKLENIGTEPIVLKKGIPVSDSLAPNSGYFLMAVLLPASIQSTEMGSVQAGSDWGIKSFTDDGNYLMLAPVADIQISVQNSISIQFAGFASDPHQIPQEMSLNLYNLDSSIIGDGNYTTNAVILQVPKPGNQDLNLIAQPEEGSSVVNITPTGASQANTNEINFYLTNDDPLASAIPSTPNVSYIRISFDTGNEIGDLTSVTDAANAIVSILRDYGSKFTLSVEKIQNIPTWKFTASTDIFLNGGSNDRIEFQLSNLISHLEEGIANVYLEFFNIPGFNDGYKTFSLQKVLPSAVISSLSLSPNRIIYGNQIIIAWQTQGASYCTLQCSSIGSIVDASGNTIQNYQQFPANETGLTVTPVLPQLPASTSPVSFSITLTAFTEDGRGGSPEERAVQIEPVSCSLSASISGPILSGTPVTLKWISNYAFSLEIDQGIGTVQANGSIQLIPVNTTTYTLTATGLYGPITSQVTVVVSQVKINSFTPSATSGVLGEKITLTWDVVFATIIDINGQKLTSDSGSIELPLTVSSNLFTLTCQGGEGPAIQSITIPATDAVQITNMNGYIQGGGVYINPVSAIFNWATANATSCTVTANGNIVSNATSGSTNAAAGTGDNPQTVTFVVTAEGPGGPISQSYAV